MSTTLHTKRRRLSNAISRQGGTISGLFAYPTFHEVFGNTHFVVVYSVEVDDGTLQVVADSDNAHYEWVWFRLPEQHSEATAPVVYTRAGFGSVGYALHDGLKHAYGEVSA